MAAAADIEQPVAADASPQAMVKTLGKALSLLDLVARADHPPTTGELAQMAGLARPTTHRLVQTLVAAGFLQQSERDGRLSIGLAVLPLAASILDRHRLRTDALPHLQALAQKLNARVNMGVLHQNRVMILAGAEKPNLPTIYSRFGHIVPVHCTGLGKAMLAWLPEPEVRAIVAPHPMEARTENTLTTLPGLLDDLEATRERGWSRELRENTASSCCVAVAVLDSAGRPVAAISVAGRSLEVLEQEIGPVLETAEAIGHMLR